MLGGNRFATDVTSPATGVTSPVDVSSDAHLLGTDHVSPAVADTKIKSRLDYVDVLRALAALSVYLVHVYQYWLLSPVGEARGFTPRALIIRFMSLGAGGVDLFIVISGFCLAYPLYRGRPRDAGPRRLTTLRFYRRRAFRILPAYYLALVVFFGLELIRPIQRELVAHPVNGWDLVSHLFFVQTWFTSTIGSINGPFWTIALEVQLYLAFPLLLVMIRKWGLAPSIAILVLVAAVWTGVAHVWYSDSLSRSFGANLNYELPARWCEFAFGVGAARLATAPRKSDLHVGVAALVVGAPLGLASEALNSNLGRAYGWGLFSVGILIVCSFLPHSVFSGNVVARALKRIGLVSFSFYLLHQPILLVLDPKVRLPHLHLGQMETILLSLSAGLAIVFAAASLFFRLVERPFLVRGGMRDAVDYSEG